MYRNKNDVDKHVETLTSKLSLKEFKTRAYSIARLYFEVGDFVSCVKYAELYLSSKDKNLAARKLLGQAFQKLGQKEKALEQYKTSLEIDPSQTNTILDICELLTDDEVTIDPGRVKYWCEKAEAIFPRHPVTFRLRERLLKSANSDPEALVKLLNAELEARPKDVVLHVRLLKHYLSANQIKEAFEHSCNIEFDRKLFSQNIDWYDVASLVLKHNSHHSNDWLYQLLLLTVKEKLCLLSLVEVPSGSSKSLFESNDLLFAYDQAIKNIACVGAPFGFAEFHSCLLQHHRGQLAFHTATFLLKKAKKDQIGWRESVKLADPLMLIACHETPIDTKANWLLHAPEKQKLAVLRWSIEGSYRCSQSGHYLLSNSQGKSQIFIDQLSQYCLGTEWKDKLFEKIYSHYEHHEIIKTSYLASNSFIVPVLRLPRRREVQVYDDDAQREYPNSLHHLVWILLNYKNYADFKCTLYNMLSPTFTNCGPEALNNLDVQAFVYCAALTAAKQKSNFQSYVITDKPHIIPANITDLLCTLTQMKWWDCAYKFFQNELGTDLTDIRATLSSGIEVVRCIDNHGLDPELLCLLGRIFSERAKNTTVENESSKLEMRAFLYYSAAIPLLTQMKSKTFIKIPEKRMFDYTHTELSPKELNSFIEESKLYVALICFRDGEFEKVVELLSDTKTPKAYYYLSQTYKKVALDEKFSKDTAGDSKRFSLLNKSKHFAFKALEKMKESEDYKESSLYSETQELIEEVDMYINKLDQDFSCVGNNTEEKHSSDENISSIGTEQFPLRSNYHFRNISSTPKRQSQTNVTYYRTAIDSQLIENNRLDNQYLERIEKQIKNLQKRDTMVNEFIEQTRAWINDNNKKRNEIINTINSNTEMITDQFKSLKISLDQIKGQIYESKNESKDVVDLKKQIADLKKEVVKLKKVSSEQTIDENDFYNLDENYRTSDTTSTFTPHMAFNPSQVMPPFTQRLVPPFPIASNPYQLYGPNLYSLYSQYSQFAQPQSIPGAPIFDPTRGQMNYPNMYQTPDQMYLDVAHLIPPNMSATSAPTASTVSTVPIAVSTKTVMSTTATITSAPSAPLSTTATVLKPPHIAEVKEPSRSLPVNVVITSSDPLPTCTTTPLPILSVTIPPQHIKASPHNYQIPMPSTNESKVVSPPKFSFIQAGNTQTTTINASSIWNSTIFTGSQPASLFNNSLNLDKKISVVVSESSPNISINKSRTLSEKSNTSVENYDPCPDFKPIIPLPAEVKVTTGEEDEVIIFNARAKLFRFVDKQWKERGLGEMKLLQHKKSGKVRVLMRREQIHKVCANHIILPEMEIKPMRNETKAYFWVANDFAEETVILEKFCIRFKTADVAKQFYDAFEKARLEALISSSDNVNLNQKQDETIVTKESNATANDQNKTIIGGFSFTNTPSFKTLNDTKKSDKSTPEPAKSNVFSNLSFKTNSETQFSNLFNVTSKQSDAIPFSEQQPNTSTLNTSDIVEEYEPTLDFKPVIPLPALVDHKTGEEDEILLFEHRAKLLRYDASTKEWKERGLGNMKLLMQRGNNDKIRLLMRREQIMKVCCNHAINKEMIFQKMPNMDKAVTWCAKDFSDGELIAETFCLRFKTVQICDEFVKAVKVAQSNIKNSFNEVKEEQNMVKQNSKVSSGNDSNNKTGSCSCENCLTSSLGSNIKLPCCQLTKPQIESSSDWGDKFKTKPGSWECKVCYIRNESNAEICCACNNSKTPNPSTADTKHNSKKENSFNFVMPVKSSSGLNSWGDKFKPKEGSWECNQCFVRNEGDVYQCSACSSPKDPTTLTKSVPINSAPKFTFGIPHNVTSEQNVKIEPQSISNTQNTQKFTFGIPTTKSSVISFGEQKLTSGYFDASKPLDKKEPLNFSVKMNTGMPAPQKTNIFLPSQPNVSKNFDFTFKSTQNEWRTKENNAAALDQVPLPSSPFSTLKEIVGGVIREEDNESLIFGQKANLYNLISGKWEKQAVGIVKVLKHNENNKLRILMRQDQDSHICLNYHLTPETKYKHKDDKSWHICVIDSSDKEPSLEHFCLRFPNAEFASKFKNAVDEAFNLQKVKKETENDEVVFVGEIVASIEEKQKAIKLKLPENFYNYKNTPPCPGCRGCNDDGDVDEAINTAVSLVKSKSTTEPPETQVSTPIKQQNAQTPTNSFYGTPGNFNETVDVSIFRTPSGSTVSNTSLLITNNNIVTGTSDDKENKTERPDVFTGFAGQKLTFSGTSNAQSNIFSIQPSSIIKKPILALPKFDALNSNESIETKTKTDENKSPFGGAGISNNKSLFQLPSDKDSTQVSEIKSLFGDDQKPVNIFSGDTQGSMFGPSVLKVNEKNVGGFSSLANQGVSETVATCSKVDANNYQTDTVTKQISKENAGLKENNEENELTNLAPILKIDNALSFAALSTSGPGFNIQKKADFKWEGAGQQLFTGRSNNNDQTQDISANEENESKEHVDGEYDPHYEPIVPLPDKIVVTTGEEDEQKVFGERCKLFRYDDKSREWKERGIGEIKVLFHPKRETYRLLLRRELVHKAVLNMLLFPDLELLPMKNSDRAWTWAGINYAENVAGEQETLAVRFKSINLATNFRDKVIECVRKLQAAAAEEIRKAKEITENQSGSVAPLRLPKHLESSARVNLAIKTVEQTVKENEPKDEIDSADHRQIIDEASVVETKQVHFEETEDDDTREDDEYEDNLYQDEEYNEEEEEEAGVYFSCEGEAIVKMCGETSTCSHAHIQVVFDQDIYSPKIVVTDSNTGEVLADTVIYIDTEFQISDDSCTWSGADFDSVNKTVTVNFPDSKTAMYFYDSCETSKTAMCSSMDPDS